LACRAALDAITDLKYADDEEQSEYAPTGREKDCIATVRSLINAVRSS
jgi:hypothetical protein